MVFNFLVNCLTLKLSQSKELKHKLSKCWEVCTNTQKICLNKLLY